MVYTIAVMAVILGFGSFAMDYGRVQLAKTQLRVAADSAARAAAPALGSITNVQDLAAQYAALNTCDGLTVTIDKTTDVEFLAWDTTTRTYTVLAGAARTTADAVRVTCKRTGANGVPLLLTRTFGMNTFDVKASAIVAMIPPGFGLVGINYISLKGNSSASYWSSTGSFSGNSGNIASNGNITSTTNASIQGTIWTVAGATVSGITSNARRTLTQPLSYANGSSAPYSATTNDNGLLPSGVISANNWNIASNKTYSIPAGHYYVKNFSCSGTMNLLGSVTIYCYGTFNLGGQGNTASNLPKNLNILMIPDPTNGSAPGAVSVSSGSAIYANFYAPQSDITLGGSGAIYGQVIGKSITMSGTSDIYYDLSLAGGSGVAQIVQ
jgi:Flp pilus assembly protein TadG